MFWSSTEFSEFFLVFDVVIFVVLTISQLLNVKMLFFIIFRISILSEGFETSAQQFGSGKLSRWLNFCQSIFTFLSIHFIFLSIHFYISVDPFYISVNPFLHFCRSIYPFLTSNITFFQSIFDCGSSPCNRFYPPPHPTPPPPPPHPPRPPQNFSKSVIILLGHFYKLYKNI